MTTPADETPVALMLGEEFLLARLIHDHWLMDLDNKRVLHADGREVRVRSFNCPERGWGLEVTCRLRFDIDDTGEDLPPAREVFYTLDEISDGATQWDTLLELIRLPFVTEEGLRYLVETGDSDD